MLPDKLRHQAEEIHQAIIEERLKKKNRNVGDQQEFDGSADRSTTERRISGLVLHVLVA
jgi:hypothetical protein